MLLTGATSPLGVAWLAPLGSDLDPLSGLVPVAGLDHSPETALAVFVRAVLRWPLRGLVLLRSRSPD